MEFTTHQQTARRDELRLDVSGDRRSIRDTFQGVCAPFKWGVDPVPRFSLSSLPPGCRFSTEPSDAFFHRLPANYTFDVIFLDGLHEWTQTYRDLTNALAHSTTSSFILIDDVVPSDEFSALPTEAQALSARARAGNSRLEWHGNVFKVLLAIRAWHPELSFRVMDAELGNPQAIVWRNEPCVTTAKSSEELSTAFESVTYFDAFGANGAPLEWELTPEDQAISDALARAS